MPELSMINDDSALISALTSKKAAINSEINTLKHKITSLTSGLTHIDATIKLLSVQNPYETPTKRPRRTFCKYKECKTIILDMLRVSDKPINTNDIANYIANKLHIAQDDFFVFQKSVLSSLKGLEARKIVKMCGKDGAVFMWCIDQI